LLFLGLAFCVFSWGLQYKLSLYDPPQAISHEIPQAKLLSKDQQSPTGKGLLAKDGRAADKAPQAVLYSFFLAFLLGLTTACFLKIAGRYSPSFESVQPSIYTGLAAFFFRPPPVLA